MEISMRSKYIVLSVALSVSVMSIAWSADEPAPPAVPAAQPAATPAAQPATQAAPAAQAAASSTGAEAKAPAKETATAASSTNSTAAEEKQLLSAGYKKKTHNGQTFYCRKEMPIGSRFETERCGTAQDLAQQAQQARELLNGNKISAGSRN
jgi:hypothetical protein